MRRRPAAVLCVLLLAVLVLSATPVAGAEDRTVEPCAVAPPDDFSDPSGNTSEVVGWVDGTWYNETVGVEADEPLSPDEAEAVATRSAARVEALRCLAFEERPSVRFESRDEFREEQAGVASNTSEAYSRFENARLEALLMVGSEDDAVEARAETLGGAARGYYDPAAEEVVLVVDDPEEPRIDEVILAHEYLHALQDQHFGLGQFDARLTDAHGAQEGLIEGDAVLVEHRYEQRCIDEWECTEGEPLDDDGGGDGVPGIELELFQSYNDGPAFVERAYDEGGWDAVDALYENPPTTTHHTIYPESYAGFEPASVEIANHTNETDGEWTRVRPEDRPEYDRIGPGSIAAAAMAPTFESPLEEDRLYNELQLYNIDGTQRDDLVPFDYDVDTVRGWEGDRFEVYADADGATTSVWRIDWANTDAATTFRDRYARLLLIREATPSEDREGNFLFDDADDFSGVVFLGLEDDEVVVVHAPDRNEIVEYYQPQLEYAHNESWDPSAIGGNPPATEAPDDELPGPGIVAALAALLAVAAALARSRA